MKWNLVGNVVGPNIIGNMIVTRVMWEKLSKPLIVLFKKEIEEAKI